MEQGEIRKIVGDALLAQAAELQLRIQMLQQELQQVTAEINKALAVARGVVNKSFVEAA